MKLQASEGAVAAQSCEKAREEWYVILREVYFHGVFGFDMAERSGLREMEGQAVGAGAVRSESMQCPFEIVMVLI